MLWWTFYERNDRLFFFFLSHPKFDSYRRDPFFPALVRTSSSSHPRATSARSSHQTITGSSYFEGGTLHGIWIAMPMFSFISARSSLSSPVLPPCYLQSRRESLTSCAFADEKCNGSDCTLLQLRNNSEYCFMRSYPWLPRRHIFEGESINCRGHHLWASIPHSSVPRMERSGWHLHLAVMIVSSHNRMLTFLLVIIQGKLFRLLASSLPHWNKPI